MKVLVSNNPSNVRKANVRRKINVVVEIIAMVCYYESVERGAKMNSSKYDCKFSVLAVPRKRDMFIMNMQVFDVVPHKIDSEEPGRPVSVVWAAVFNLQGIHKT
jgi:hypothetical protein